VTQSATIASFSYTPSDVQIRAGDTVVWRNLDPTVHTVTASRGEFASASMRQGQTFAVQFNAPGVYPYFCEPHEFMRGTVSVFAADASGSTGSTTTTATTVSAGNAARPTTTVAVVNAPTTTAPVTSTTARGARFVVGPVRGSPEQSSPVGAVAATIVVAVAVAVLMARRGGDAFRAVAVIATLATGVLHLQLRVVLDYPEPIGTLLVIEAGAAAVLAAWLAAAPLTPRRRAIAIAAHAAALAALAVTRTSFGLFGFHEFGWDPSPQLPLALALGAVAIAALALGTVLRSHPFSPVE
jgi:hypothetical protein